MSAAKCETGWGDSLSSRTVPELRDHPTPLATQATLPLQGRVSGATPSVRSLTARRALGILSLKASP
jgi:hypothetical protein